MKHFVLILIIIITQQSFQIKFHSQNIRTIKMPNERKESANQENLISETNGS